jgi:glucose/arabinose dehydrogenase
MSRALKLLAATLACSCVPAVAAQAAKGPPPPPTSPSGKTVTQVVGLGAGTNTPTSFAFGAGQVFEGDGGADSNNAPPNGGVFLLKGGTATKLAGSPMFVAGLAWHKGALYVSGGSFTKTGATFTIQKWSGWNGSTFSSQKAIYTASKKFQGFNGIAFGPDGRLYVGVDAGLLNGNDHGPATKSPYLYSILSMKANGKGLKVFATGIRQPWQLAFAPGSKNPLVSALGQDAGANEKKVPDFVLKVHQGDNYGFPQCNHLVPAKCKGFAKPFQVFKPHTDIMGMAIIGKRLYMTSFAGTSPKSKGGEVLSMPLTGGKLTPVLTGFAAPTVGLGASAGTLYVGEVTGRIFSVKP